jgi:hypothetical protein
MSGSIKTKKKTKAPAKQKKEKTKQEKNIENIENLILYCIENTVSNIDDSAKLELTEAIKGLIIDTDNEIQFIRDTRLRDFLRKHIEDKFVLEFLDSIGSLKIVEYMASRSV